MKAIVINSPEELKAFFASIRALLEHCKECEECDECDECEECDECDECEECDEGAPVPENCTGEQDIWEYSRDLRADLELTGRTVVKQQAEIKKLRSDVDLLMDGTAKLIREVRTLRVKCNRVHADKLAAITSAIDDAFARIRSRER